MPQYCVNIKQTIWATCVRLLVVSLLKGQTLSDLKVQSLCNVDLIFCFITSSNVSLTKRHDVKDTIPF